jgi:hypothetical protein
MLLCEASKDCMYVINATESLRVPLSLQVATTMKSSQRVGLKVNPERLHID